MKIMGTEKAESAVNRRESVAIYSRYWRVKAELDISYKSRVKPYLEIVRLVLACGVITNPLLAGAAAIESMRLCSKKDRADVDLILCAAVEICLQTQCVGLQMQGRKATLH